MCIYSNVQTIILHSISILFYKIVPVLEQMALFSVKAVSSRTTPDKINVFQILNQIVLIKEIHTRSYQLNSQY